MGLYTQALFTTCCIYKHVFTTTNMFFLGIKSLGRHIDRNLSYGIPQKFLYRGDPHDHKKSTNFKIGSFEPVLNNCSKSVTFFDVVRFVVFNLREINRDLKT